MNILGINLILFLLLSFFLLGIIKSKVTKKLFVILITIQFVILNGLRSYNVGVDTIRYEKSFLEVLNFNAIEDFLTSEIDFGYRVFLEFMTIFTDDFNMYLLIFAILTFALFGIIIYKYSKSIFLSYILFIGLGFFDHSFNIARQTLSIIIVLYSFKFIISRNFLKFLIVVCIAIVFHTAAFIFLPAYFIAQMKWSKTKIIIITIICTLISIFSKQIGKLLTFIYYDDAEAMINQYESAGSIGGLAVFIIVLLFIGLFIRNPIKHDDFQNRALFNIMVISLLIQLMSSFSYLFSRLNLFYLVFVIYYIPYLLYILDKGPIKFKTKELIVVRLIAKFIITLVLILYYLNLIKINGPGILPYTFFWE
ncbi:hypothetical protein CIL05_00055 [Virgibacillus profundi]|uniref:EpsG family protein n=1 Tax=Virgibacillus profundi TaxID=2024555 RepID=A0A2A2IH43_9BACI|nr:EpsG family protein [Virgibacillus profundi]PAV31089.1 hypothetical protein CIL05_00055 [Virgibacillus profundi]PXY55272.1 EpsG family protein [Virgibacillus profundi]